MHVFVTINNDGMKKNGDVNVKNQLTKEHAIRDLFEIIVILSVTVIIRVILENIWIIKIVSVEKI